MNGKKVGKDTGRRGEKSVREIKKEIVRRKAQLGRKKEKKRIMEEEEEWREGK